jgi:hypothetical protein
MNRGKQKNKSTEFATVTFELWTGDKKNVDSVGIGKMVFWVTGKPNPHGAGWFGQGTALTQQQIDALPATTKILAPFQRTVTIPPLAPGESSWVSTDFTLPDPGTFGGPFPPNAWGFPTFYGGSETAPPAYIDASKISECADLTAFFASYIRLNITAEFRRVLAGESYTSPPVNGPVKSTYGRQLPQVYLNYMNIPANKYTGKCK